METDGGGWTVFQRRQDGSVDFYRNWTDYEDGFGDFNGEFWLGLSKIHRLTQEESKTLRVDLGDFDNNTVYAQYSTFSIGDSSSKYILTVDNYNGTAGDGLHLQNGYKFSTKDSDNDDKSNGHCAQIYRGAWWFSFCHLSHLNGPYHHNPSVGHAHGVGWAPWKGRNYSLKFTEMKTRQKY